MKIDCQYIVDTSALSIYASVAPWDSQIFGCPVIHIEQLKVIDLSRAKEEFFQFEAWRDSMRSNIVSCRLPDDELKASMFLEERDFRFIEMILHPLTTDLHDIAAYDKGLIIERAKKSDIPLIQDIAERSFHYERYHIDPRIDSHFGDARYGQWVTSGFEHQKQYILKILEKQSIIAFFLVEVTDDNNIYWHLTAVSPEFQGLGYGERIWKAILYYHSQRGVSRVRTSISARNIPVLNLYAKLGFRFNSPEMTFHWVAD